MICVPKTGFASTFQQHLPVTSGVYRGPLHSWDLCGSLRNRSLESQDNRISVVGVAKLKTVAF